MTTKDLPAFGLPGNRDPDFLNSPEKIDAMRARLYEAARETLEKFDRQAAEARVRAPQLIAF